MSSALLTPLDSLADWRSGLDRGLARLITLLDDGKLLDAQARALADALRQRLASDRLVLAFVAEFSRGKSELINALFFADAGRRVLPATPGRTTMCPVELAWDPTLPPSLALLPIATRASGLTLGGAREQPALWRQVPLPVGDAEGLAQALQAVTGTLQVSVDEARALGFWRDDSPEHNPPRDAQDRIEVPAWRHALINWPHPLLRRGLVVLDTPGLNAIGAEPELTLALLPSAHAAVFVLAADTGVTQSDLAVWRDHLGDRGCERFVVLNKIDTLVDPLLDAAQVEAQVQRQCEQAAATLGVEPGRVFALSARQALAARVQHDDAVLAASRLPALEQALMSQLLPKRAQVIGRMVEDGALALQQSAQRRLADRQRQTAGQLHELRSLRGKSSARLKLVSLRLEGEAAAFERCAPRLAALRAVLGRQLQALQAGLGGDRVREAVQRMRDDSQHSLFKLGAARAFAQLGQALRSLLVDAERQVDDIDQMLQASQRPLNAEFGFELVVPPRPRLDEGRAELDRIEAAYGQYVGLTQVWRLAQPDFLTRFTRMLHSRVRIVFEGAAQEIDLWARAVGTQIDDQLRERRRALSQRREAHGRIRDAEDGLERSIQALAAQEAQLAGLAERIASEVDRLRIRAATPPASVVPPPSVRLQLVAAQPPAPPVRGAA